MERGLTPNKGGVEETRNPSVASVDAFCGLLGGGLPYRPNSGIPSQ